MPTSKKALLDSSYDEMGQDGNLIKRDASFEREYIMSEEGFARIQAMPLFDEVTAGTFSFDDTDAPQKNDQNKALKESPSTDKSLAAEALQQLMSSTSFIQNSPLKVANDSIIQDVVHDNQSVQRFQQSQASIGATSYMVSPSAPAPPPSFYTRGPGMIYVNAPQYVHQVRMLKFWNALALPKLLVYFVLYAHHTLSFLRQFVSRFPSALRNCF